MTFRTFGLYFSKKSGRLPVAMFTPHPPHTNARTSGFTLVEVAIVLVIISFLVGGILVGRLLIEQAKVHKQITQLGEYERALSAFRLKYNLIPGDLTNAQSSQLFAGAGYASCSSLLGDGFLSYTVYDTTNTCREPIYFFKHLGASGLIGSAFDGTFTRSGIPAAAISDNVSLAAGGMCCGVTGSQLTTAESSKVYTVAFYLTYFDFAGGGQGRMSGADRGIKVETVWNIDKKIDDGVARQGKVKAYTLRGNAVNTCLDANDGNYNFTTTAGVCTLEYIAIP
jgi:prepilin-type N-terminal cleavage/methylation domain-containing protein